MNKEVGLTAEMFGLGAGIFFIGYFVFEVPSTIIPAPGGGAVLDWAGADYVGSGVAGDGVYARAAEFLYAAIFAGAGGGGLFSGDYFVPELLVSGAAPVDGDGGVYGGGLIAGLVGRRDFGLHHGISKG